jgi:hypothetical protein
MLEKNYKSHQRHPTIDFRTYKKGKKGAASKPKKEGRHVTMSETELPNYKMS